MNAHDQISSYVAQFWRETLFKGVTPLPALSERITRNIAALVEKDRAHVEAIFGGNCVQPTLNAVEFLQEAKQELIHLEGFAGLLEKDLKATAVAAVTPGARHDSKEKMIIREGLIASMQRLSHIFSVAMAARLDPPTRSLNDTQVALAAENAGRISALSTRLIGHINLILDEPRSGAAKTFTLRQVLLTGEDFSKILGASKGVSLMKSAIDRLEQEMREMIAFPAPDHALAR